MELTKTHLILGVIIAAGSIVAALFRPLLFFLVRKALVEDLNALEALIGRVNRLVTDVELLKQDLLQQAEDLSMHAETVRELGRLPEMLGRLSVAVDNLTSTMNKALEHQAEIGRAVGRLEGKLSRT